MNIKIKVYVIYLFHWIVENTCLNTVSLKNACLIWLVTLFWGGTGVGWKRNTRQESSRKPSFGTR